jgi:hypothetical protein
MEDKQIPANVNEIAFLNKLIKLVKELIKAQKDSKASSEQVLEIPGNENKKLTSLRVKFRQIEKRKNFLILAKKSISEFISLKLNECLERKGSLIEKLKRETKRMKKRKLTSHSKFVENENHTLTGSQSNISTRSERNGFEFYREENKLNQAFRTSIAGSEIHEIERVKTSKKDNSMNSIQDSLQNFSFNEVTSLFSKIVLF